jgi:hypothetical protein
MPWSPSDAQAKTKKADNPTAQRQWAEVANGVLAKTGDEGRAVREANAVVARRAQTKLGRIRS